MLPGIVLGSATLAATPAAMACGFENSADMAIGLLNWAYPKALYVRTALWQAENAGILPARKAKPLMGPLGFYKVSGTLRKLGERMNAAVSSGAEMPDFSVVQIDTALWTQYVHADDGYSTLVHADGPGTGHIVLVTVPKVLDALLDGSLTPERAETSGLVRFYGDEAGQERLRKALAAVLMASFPAHGNIEGLPKDAASPVANLQCGPPVLGGRHDRVHEMSQASKKGTSN